MKTDRTGEFIELIYDGQPTDFYIRGHISDDQALEILNYYDVLTKIEMKLINKDYVPIEYKAEIEGIYHRYGRWSIEPGPDGTTQVLRDYKDKGRGRFPVTQITIKDWKINSSNGE
jgi:hypothetical protein